MPNSIATGVAYADPAFTSVTTTGSASFLTSSAPAAAAATPVGIKFSSTANLGVYFGTGTPNAVVSAAQGSLYINTTGSSTSTRIYVNTDGATAWTSVTTAT